MRLEINQIWQNCYEQIWQNFYEVRNQSSLAELL